MPEITFFEIVNAVVILSLVIGGTRMYFLGRKHGRAEHERELEEIVRTIDMDSVLPAMNDFMQVIGGLCANPYRKSAGDQEEIDD